MRLIDADALKEELNSWAVDLTKSKYPHYIKDDVDCIIDNAPTIDPASMIEKPVYLDAEKVAKIVKERLVNNGTIYIDGPMIENVPVRHGHWESVGRDTPWLKKCSECNTLVDNPETGWDYCPSCGARMDGDDNEID